MIAYEKKIIPSTQKNIVGNHGSWLLTAYNFVFSNLFIRFHKSTEPLSGYHKIRKKC